MANLHQDFFWDKMSDFINAGFWVVLPLEQMWALGKDLCLFPLVVKEEINHQPWVIVNHTWFSMNDHTMVELLPEVMQFSGALSCILWLLRHANPSKGPVYLAKYNISDGFYQIFLNPEDTLKLSVLMPHYEGELQLVAVPLSLTMRRWVLPPSPQCSAWPPRL